MVPGVGTAPPETWFEGKGQSWPQILPDHVLPSPVVYQFDHKLSLDTDSKIWSDVLDRGLGFLEALLNLLDTRLELRNCAIVFIAHSLGGILVKQCLAEALGRRTDFKYIARATALFVAIATPHSKSRDPKDWNQVKLLVGLRNRHKKGPAATLDDAKRLAALSLRFEEVVMNLYILTFYETKETPIKSLFIRGSKALVVPNTACRIHSRLEEHVDVDASHLDICSAVTGKQLEKSTSVAISAALSRITRELQEDVPCSVLAESAIATRDAEDQLWNQSAGARDNNTSNQATMATSESRREGMSQLSDFSTIKRDPRLPCHIIPGAKNKDFYGRREIIDKIEKCLAPSELDGGDVKSTRAFAVCGPGGMGKTQVANEFVLTHMEMYEAIFWVHAEEATTLADEFSRLAVDLGLVLEGTADARDQVVTRELLKGWLAKPLRSYNRTGNSDEEVSWLLVFDNVNDANLLSEFWPAAGVGGAILVTSRDSLAKTRLYQIPHGEDLPPLTDQEAAELLLKLTWRENDPEERKLSMKVAEKLGGFPLALTQMTGVMNRQNLSFSDFLQRYEEEETHGALFHTSLEPSHKRTNYAHTLATVWALEELRYGSSLLDIMAFLDPDGIPEKYLVNMVDKIKLPGYPATIKAYHDARSELFRSSLIMNDRSASRLTVHRLVQDGARAKMSPERSTEVFATAVDLLWSMWPQAESGVRHHVARWKDCEQLSPHVLRMKEHYVRAGKALRLRWIANLNFATMLNELGWYFQERGHTLEALDCYNIARTNVEHIIGTHENQESSPHSDIQDKNKANRLHAEIHNHIAGSATELNDADTALHHFKIYNQMLIDEHKDQSDVFDSRLTSSFFNVGLSYTMKGTYEDAIPCFQHALKEAEKLTDPAKVKVARALALINLGLTLWLMQRLDEALDCLQTALKEREELLGPNDRQSMITGRILHCLGNVKCAQGLLEESLEYHERALLHFKETVGSTHHRTGNSCFKVAEHYSRLKNFPEAIELLGQAHQIFDWHSCYNPEKGRVTFLKSVILRQQGQIGESNDSLLTAHALYKSFGNVLPSRADLSLEDFDRYVHVWGR